MRFEDAGAVVGSSAQSRVRETRRGGEQRCDEAPDLRHRRVGDHGWHREKRAQYLQLVATSVTVARVRSNPHAFGWRQQLELIMAKRLRVGTVKAVERAAQTTLKLFRLQETVA